MLKKVLLVTGCGAEVGASKPALTRETAERVLKAAREYPIGNYDIVVVSEGACTHGAKAAEIMAELFRRHHGCEGAEILVDDEAGDTCQNVEFAAKLLRKLKGLKPSDVELTIVCEPREQYKRAWISSKVFGFRRVKNIGVEVPGGFTITRRVMGWIFMAITLTDPKGLWHPLIMHSRKFRREMWDKELARH